MSPLEKHTRQPLKLAPPLLRGGLILPPHSDSANPTESQYE